MLLGLVKDKTELPPVGSPPAEGAVEAWCCLVRVAVKVEALDDQPALETASGCRDIECLLAGGNGARACAGG